MSTPQCKLDPLQFAYQAGRGVEDAKLFILDTIYKHLERSHTYARLLFADFSSAFNTMQPVVSARKLKANFHLADQLILWIVDFLTNRPQKVFVNNRFSDVITTCTGSPKGCFLSPLLFILYTDDYRSKYEDSFLVKFSDDTALLSLCSDDKQDHGPVPTEFVDWCDDTFLELNVEKTKEMVIDFGGIRVLSATASFMVKMLTLCILTNSWVLFLMIN